MRLDREVVMVKISGEFQFTHPGKGATLDRRLTKPTRHVSIHAPWEGCDWDDFGDTLAVVYVSIHAPWEGCDAHSWLVT